jgi:hypothetical protein
MVGLAFLWFFLNFNATLSGLNPSWGRETETSGLQPDDVEEWERDMYFPPYG